MRSSRYNREWEDSEEEPDEGQDADFDYDEYIEEEFGQSTSTQYAPWIRVVAMVLLIVFAGLALLQMGF